MIIYEEVPLELSKRISTWNNAKEIFQKRAEEAKGYFYNNIQGTGTTYTAEQKANIEKTTGIPVSIPFLYPIVAQEHSIITRSKFSSKVVPLDDRPGAKQFAYVLDKAKHALLYSSESQAHNSQAVKEALVTGLAHVALLKKNFFNYGEFDASYQHLPIENTVVDPASRIVTGEDSRGWFYWKKLPYDMTERLYNPIIQIINEYYGRELKVDDFINKGVAGLNMSTQGDLMEEKGYATAIMYYDKRIAEMFYVRNPETEVVERLFKENYFPEQQELIFTEENIVGSEVNYYVVETTILGDKIIKQDYEPITLHKIKNLYFEWGGSPYEAKGIVHFGKGMQETIDKTIQMLILNGMLQNNAGWTAPIGSIPKEQEENWRVDGANPMALKQYVAVPIGDNQWAKPERDVIQPLGQYYPYIITLMKDSIEYVTGINPMIQGNPSEGKVDVFASLQQYQNAAMMRIMTITEQFQEVQTYMGKVIIQHLLGSLKPNNYFTFFNEQGEFDEMKVTKEMLENLTTTNFTVLSVPAEGMPTQRMAMATELMKISQTTPDPQERNIYIKEALRLSDIRSFDKLQEQLDEVAKLNQELQQMQEQVERDKELIKQYENRALDAEYNEKLAQKLASSEAAVKVAEKATELQLKIDMLQKQLKEKEKGSGK